jgi:hypothetical protein
MAQLSISDIIKLGDISVPLSSNYQVNGNLFGKRLAFTAPITIAIVTDALRWQYEGFPTIGDNLATESEDPLITQNFNNIVVSTSENISARGVANYLYWLCGKFALEAQFLITGAGGGTVIPIMPGSTPSPIEFEVTASSYMVNGQSTVTIPSFKGYNLLFVRNNVPQSIIDMGGGSSYFSWNKVTGVFTCYPAATSGELFQLYPFI